MRLSLRIWTFFNSLALPSGCEFSTDRGAEQGDVLGTIQSALVLGDARASHLQDFLSSPFEQKGVCDEWFVDDGAMLRSAHAL